MGMKYTFPKNFYSFVNMFDDLYHVHIPKTGGTAVNRVYHKFNIDINKNPIIVGAKYQEGNRMSHNTCCPGIPFFNPYCYNNKKYRNALRFSIVRNPYSMIVSAYLHDKRHGRPSKFFNFETRDTSFEDFLKISSNKGSWFFEHWRRFLFMQIFNEKGFCAVDLVLRNENLTSGIDNLLKAINIPGTENGLEDKNGRIYLERYNTRWNRTQPPLLKIDTSYKKFYKHDWMVELTAKTWGRELEAFGYNFDGPIDNFCILNPSCIKYNPIDDSFSIDKNKSIYDNFKEFAHTARAISIKTTKMKCETVDMPEILKKHSLHSNLRDSLKHPGRSRGKCVWPRQDCRCCGRKKQ